jgi:hypothetical protein
LVTAVKINVIPHAVNVVPQGLRGIRGRQVRRGLKVIRDVKDLREMLDLRDLLVLQVRREISVRRGPEVFQVRLVQLVRPVLWGLRG